MRLKEGYVLPSMRVLQKTHFKIGNIIIILLIQPANNIIILLIQPAKHRQYSATALYSMSFNYLSMMNFITSLHYQIISTFLYTTSVFLMAKWQNCKSFVSTAKKKPTLQTISLFTQLSPTVFFCVSATMLGINIFTL